MERRGDGMFVYSLPVLMLSPRSRDNSDLDIIAEPTI